MEKKVPDVDMPVDFLAETGITEEILSLYKYPCRLKAAVFAFCVQGQIRASVNLTEYRIRGNSLICLPPGSIIQFHEASKDLRIYMMGFASRLVSSVNLIKSALDYFPVLIENPVLPLKEEIADIQKDYFQLLYKAFVGNRLGDPELIQCILLTVLKGVGNMYREQSKSERMLSRGEDITRQLMRLIMKHYTRERRVSFYADLLNLSPQHLCVTVKQHTGKTVTDLIADVVVMDAKAQLKSSNLTIQEISYSLHFPNVSFFGKYFKRHVGMTPQQYRNS